MRVSTHAIEQDHSESGAAARSRAALSWTWDGHSFYAVSFADRTLVYDCATQRWHRRSTSVDGLGPWLPLSTAKLNQAICASAALHTGTFYVQSPSRSPRGRHQRDPLGDHAPTLGCDPAGVLRAGRGRVGERRQPAARSGSSIVPVTVGDALHGRAIAGTTGPRPLASVRDAAWGLPPALLHGVRLREPDFVSASFAVAIAPGMS